MSNRKKSRSRQRKRRFLVLNKDGYYDYSLLAVVILLTCFGLVMLYSTSAYISEVRSMTHVLFWPTGRYSAGGILMMVAISMFDYHVLKNFTAFLYVAAAILMLLVLSPLGVTVNGAKRWLKLGIQFQPSEIAKIAAIVCISYLIVQMGKQIQTLKATIVLLGIGGALGAIAYLATDNLSTGIIICGITWILVAMASPYTKYFVMITAVMFVLLLILVQVMKYSIDTADSSSFRIQRVLVWLHPEQNSDAGGYQVMQALYAIGSGGFFGIGLGNSVQKLGSVPEAQN
ncbi:MAG: FtsW/RodA/SpoVE family cell cycle protein, partial [Blautia sp.]